MTTITVGFSVAVALNNLAPAETHPTLFCYLSGHVIRGEPDYAEISLAPEPKSGQVRGHVSDRNCGVSSNTSLCFALFAWRPDSSTKVNCKICLGTDRVLLKDLVDARGSLKRRLSLKMHTVDNYEKAQVDLHVTHTDIQGLPFKNDKLDTRAVERDLGIYYRTIEEMKREMGETLGEGTDRMDAPYDFSESGFFMATMPMPFLAFAMRELPLTNAAMWESCLQSKRFSLVPRFPFVASF
jgi:hypothetical protein